MKHKANPKLEMATVAKASTRQETKGIKSVIYKKIRHLIHHLALLRETVKTKSAFIQKG